VLDAKQRWKTLGARNIEVWTPEKLEPIVRKLGGSEAWDAANKI